MIYSQERPYEYETVCLCCINMGVIPSQELLLLLHQEASVLLEMMIPKHEQVSSYS